MTVSHRRARARYSVIYLKACRVFLNCLLRGGQFAALNAQRTTYSIYGIMGVWIYTARLQHYRQLLLDISSRSHTCLCTRVTFEHWILEYQCS